MAETNERAKELLGSSERQTIIERKLSGAYKVIEVLKAELATIYSNEAEAEGHQIDFSEGYLLRNALRRYEHHILERALKAAGGSPTRAARLLGFKHHGSVTWLINHRHQDLIQVRSTVRPRKRSILADRHRRKGAASARSELGTRQITILHVEDNKEIAAVVNDLLVIEGYVVAHCGKSEAALRKLATNARYDLLLFDNDLPGLSGVELVRRARKISHRRRTPIILHSGSDCEAEAWRAGVDAFLRKGENLNVLSSTVSRLLRAGVEDEEDS